MESNSKFCTQCGKAVSTEAQYCSECGTPIAGSRAEAERRQALKDYEDMMSENRRMWVMFLMIIYAIPAIIVGVYFVVNAAQFTDILFQNSDFIAWALTYDVTPAMTESMFNYLGYLLIASGACVAIATLCVFKRRYWLVAVVLTLIGSLLFCGSIFGVLIGLMVTWMIYSMRDSFIDGSIQE